MGYLHHQKRLGLCLPLAPALPETAAAAAAAAAGACHWGGLTFAPPAGAADRHMVSVGVTSSGLNRCTPEQVHAEAFSEAAAAASA